MNSKVESQNGKKIVVMERTAQEIILQDVASALDLIMSVRYQYDTNCIAIEKSAIEEDFFRLSSGLAGEVLQKLINYNIKLAIYGDFSGYTSKPLQDFMRESNRGKDVFFVGNATEAIRFLANA